jgi:hypothetical protein
MAFDLNPQDGTNDGYDDYGSTIYSTSPRLRPDPGHPKIKFRLDEPQQKRRILVEHEAKFALPTFTYTLEELNESVLKTFPKGAKVVTVQTNKFDPMIGGMRASVEVTVRWTQEVDFDA